MNEPTPTTAPRRQRRQAMSDEGRSILQRERQRIAREQAVLGERLANEARRNDSRQALQATRVKPEEAAVQRGIVKRIAAVLASESVNVRLDVASSPAMTAWTDFQKIHVRYRQHEDKRLVAAVLRGLMYHEAGHCRWSTPFPELQDMVDVDTIPGLLPPLNEDGDQPKVEWKQYHKAWNCLEDQRMETAVVSDSPVKALYLTPLIMTELMDTVADAVANWPLLIWRRYLPRKLRAAARRDFVAIHGEALAQSFEAVTDSYVRATDAATMMAAVVEMDHLLEQINFTISDFGHDHQRRRYYQDDEATPVVIPISPEMDEEDIKDDDTEDDDIIIVIDGAAKMPESKPAEPGAPTIKGDNDSPSIDTPPAADHSKDDVEDEEDDDVEDEDDDDELTQEDIDEAKAEAEAERDADPTLDDDVESYHNAMGDRVSDLSPYINGLSSDTEASNEAEVLAAEIERSFQAATMDRQPAWVEQQPRGVLNVGRYMTRQPDDIDFYRDWVEDDQPGFNMAVSLMLDYSSSMGSYTTQLSQVGYAVKLACQRLGIPCTVTLWDTDATVLFDAIEDAEGMPNVMTAGSTDPTSALADLENQRFDKANHVVLIMTDGEWQGKWDQSRRHGRSKGRMAEKATLAYHADERMIVGFGFATGQAYADRYAENLRGYGCPEAFGITNLMEIPERLREILIALA